MDKGSSSKGSKDRGTDCSGAVVSEVNWQMVVSSAIVAGIVSLLTSVAGIPEVSEE